MHLEFTGQYGQVSFYWPQLHEELMTCAGTNTQAQHLFLQKHVNYHTCETVLLSNHEQGRRFLLKKVEYNLIYCAKVEAVSKRRTLKTQLDKRKETMIKRNLMIYKESLLSGFSPLKIVETEMFHYVSGAFC